MKIYLCDSDHAEYFLQVLQQELPEDEVLTCARDDVHLIAEGADVLIPIGAKITAASLCSSTLKLVQQFGSGLDSVDLTAAAKYGVDVANVSTVDGGNDVSVAELTIFFMLALARQYPLAKENIGFGKLRTSPGMTLMGKTAAIIGFGGIGQEIAKRVRSFAMEVLAISKHGHKSAGDMVDFHGPMDALPQVLQKADFIILAVPLNQETQGLIDQKAFSQMKTGAFVVNVARGPVIDYAALLNALETKKIAGVGLDVFWQEPIDPKDAIFDYNVIATPHIGGMTDSVIQKVAKKVANNINRVR